jgi:hypothetical protein
MQKLKMENEEHERNIELSPKNANKFIKLLSSNRKRIKELKMEMQREANKVEERGRKVIRYFVGFDSHEVMQDVADRFESYAGCCAK